MTTPFGPPPEAKGPHDPRHEGPLEALQRRWKVIVATTVLLVVIVGLGSALQGKQYAASATLLFRSTDFAQQLFGTNFLAASKDPARDAATNQNLVRLRTVADRTASALDNGLSGRQIADRVTVEAQGTSDLVIVKAVDSSPQRAAQIATEFAQQFVTFRREADQRVVNAAGDLVERELDGMTAAQRRTSQGQSLLQRRAELEILASLQTGNAELVQAAAPPESPSSPRTKRDVALAAVLGLVLGAGLALLVNRLDQGIRSVRDVERLLPVPVLAQIPRRDGLSATEIGMRPASIDLDAFRLLRSHLRYFNVDGKVRTLLITSAEAGAGKTTVAIGLGLALAQGGDRVVLVEADLRRPALRSHLGNTAPCKGLAEVLSGDLELCDALTTEVVEVGGVAQAPEITVLGAGLVAPNPAELLESARMKRVLKELGERFDVVLVDSAPPLLIPDSTPLLRVVDGVIAVCRIGGTKRSGASRLDSYLRSLDSPLLGTVVNDIRSSRQGGYGYGYGEYGSDRPDRAAEAQA